MNPKRLSQLNSPMLAAIPFLLLSVSFLNFCLNCWSDPTRSSCSDLLHKSFHSKAIQLHISLDSLTKELESNEFTIDQNNSISKISRLIPVGKQGATKASQMYLMGTDRGHKTSSLRSVSRSRKRPMEGYMNSSIIFGSLSNH